MSIFNDVNTEADKDPIVEVKGVQVIDDNTIVIDGRGKSRPAIRNIAKKHFFGSENPERDEPQEPGGDSGYFIGMHQLHYANVASVADGIIVASKKELGPKDTRPLAKEFVDSLNEVKEAEPKKLLVILNEESDDDIIVGGMGRTGVLKEFYRLDEAKRSNDQQFDDQKKVLLAKLADAYIKMAQREARDEVKGMVSPGEDDTVPSWTESFITDWMKDVKDLLPQEFEAAVKKLWK